ncbi:hypothetical protein RB195_000795 [Necator americanus]|uniref:ZP domain-containing protein n=1 Tax=Necator americanus TaxID=51031 RepID=A0ABR1DC37_NECAM
MNVFCNELKILLQVILLIVRSVAIPIDNGVDGDPEIECGASSIAVNLNTRNIFEGHVYVKPKFLTKVDRAYRVSCFYMEADKDVTSLIAVSDITTESVTGIVQMPICKYEILEGGPYGIPVQYSTIGQQVYHKWTCTSETVNTFCMVVHSCSVDDGNGDRVDILDSNGCALDRYVLNDLEYPEDLLAGQEAHVYKYADRDSLYYQCQISLQVKENGECVRPICADFFNSPPFKVFHKNRQGTCL